MLAAMDMTQAMRVLVKVVDTGSFSRAADAFDTSTAAVSRQVSALEEHLGTRLLNRTTRKLSLTDAGSEFYERSRAILDDIAEAEAVAGQQALQPVGLLRITAPLSFGVTQLSRLLPRFRTRYPQLRLDIDLSDRMVDLVNDGVDVALRIAGELSGNLVARRIAPVTMVVCAAPAYLKRRGTPRTPAELAHHDTLSFSYLWTGDDWPFTDAAGNVTRVRVQPGVHSTNGDLLRELALAGGGIILQPSFIVGAELERGALVPLLTGYRTLEFSLYAVYLSRRHLSSKVRVFIDYLVQAIGLHPPWERWTGPSTGGRSRVDATSARGRNRRSAARR
jgi:DNA-binding transcriptional LysR family regulator